VTAVPTPEVVTDESPVTLAGHRLDGLSDLLDRRADLHPVPLLGFRLAESVRESA
jgi:hypothetical protein